MGWELMVMPMAQIVAMDGVWEFYQSCEIARFPPERPDRCPHLTVGDVVQAFVETDLAGQPYFTVPGRDGTNLLRECAGEDDRETWVGTVLVDVEERGYADSLDPDERIRLLSFEKPSSLGPLTAACAFASRAPVVVFDASLRGVAIGLGDRREDVAPSWPWMPVE